MENPAVNKTYDCGRFCKIRCSDFTFNSPLNRDCIEAKDNCTCRPIWKDPAFWLIGGLIFASIALLGRLIYIYIRDRKAQNARALRMGQVATSITAKEGRESNPARTKTGLPAAKSIVVGSSAVAEHSF